MGDRSPTRADLLAAGLVLVWVPAVLLLDRDASLAGQRLLGVGTWVLLLALLRREAPLVRAQVGVVLAFATAVEYTFSPLLEVYVYRLGNVPAFVPPGHGLVYLAALCLARSALVVRARRVLLPAVVCTAGAYAGWGLLIAERSDALGAFWCGCLLLFLRVGRAPLLYAAAFLVVTYLEVLGTWIGTWEWQPRDPTGLVTIGNPPSGAAGGYAWFDLAAMLAAPTLLRWWGALRAARERGGERDGEKDADGSARWVRRRGGQGRGASRRSTSSCSRALVASALPPPGPGRPVRSLNRPPASSTTSETAARSCRATSGSAATSTEPSATSM